MSSTNCLPGRECFDYIASVASSEGEYETVEVLNTKTEEMAEENNEMKIKVSEVEEDLV